jgi:hypothetical protein
MPDNHQRTRPSASSEKTDKKQNGGARPGAGRKRGKIDEKTKLRRARAERAIEKTPITPLEVMLGAMAEDWKAAHDSTKEPDERQKLRASAVSHADRAAPYVHPKLKDVDASGSSLNRHHVMLDATAAILSVMSPEQLAKARELAMTAGNADKSG